MGTKYDTEITSKLSVRADSNGRPFEDGGVLRLYGVSGAELDYTEELTLEQVKALVTALQKAIFDASHAAASRALDIGEHWSKRPGRRS